MADQGARRLGYEPRDINVRAVLWFAIALVAMAILIHLAVAGLFVLFKKEHPSPEAPSRIAMQPKPLAAVPRLQVNPVEDLEQFRRAEETKLDSYGWVDKQAGIVRIPIKRAMQLIAERGLPARCPGSQNGSGKTPEQMRQEKATATNPK